MRRLSSGLLNASVSGTLVVLSFPPFGLGWLMWIALAPMFAIHHRLGRSGTFWYGYALASVPIWAICFAITAASWSASFAFALITPAAFAAGIMLASRLESCVSGRVAKLLVFPCCGVVLEFILGHQWVGVPATLAITQTDYPLLIQSADLFGTSGVTFLLLLVNRTWPTIWQDLRRRCVGAPLALTGCIFILNFLYGWNVLSTPRHEPRHTIATIQAAIPTSDYIDRRLDRTVQRRMDDAIDELMDRAFGSSPDLVVIPEGGNGRYNFRVPALRRRLEHLARQSGSGLMVSSLDLDPSGNEFNALFSLDRNGRLLGSYRKRLLTPLGEEDFTPGDAQIPLSSPLGRAGAMMCFESCFPSVAGALVRQGAKYLLVSTSDASFRNSGLPLLHARFSIFRAIETRRHLIQAANTGPSFVVAPTGRVENATSFLDRTVLTGSVSPRTDQTFFVRMPLTAPFAAIAYLLILGAMRTPRATPATPVGASSLRWWEPRFSAAIVALVVWNASLALASVHLATRSTPADQGALRNISAFLESPRPLDMLVASAPHRQRSANTCGPAALAYLLHLYGFDVDEDAITRLVSLDASGTSLLDLARAARLLGVEADGVRLNLTALRQQRRPLIAYDSEARHFVVVLGVENDAVMLFDPAAGLVKMGVREFQATWNGYTLGIRFRPSPDLDTAPASPHVTLAPVTDSVHDGILASLDN